MPTVLVVLGANISKRVGVQLGTSSHMHAVCIFHVEAHVLMHGYVCCCDYSVHAHLLVHVSSQNLIESISDLCPFCFLGVKQVQSSRL